MEINVLTLAIKEAHQIHAVCDRALVPRKVNGELLTMAQRVTVLERCYVGLTSRLGMEPPSTSH